VYWKFLLCLFIFSFIPFTSAKSTCSSCANIVGCLTCIDIDFVDSIFVEKCQYSNGDYYFVGEIVQSDVSKWVCSETGEWDKYCKLRNELLWKKLSEKWVDSAGDEYICENAGAHLIKKKINEPVPQSDNSSDSIYNSSETNLSGDSGFPVSADIDKQIFYLVNKERASNNLSSLQLDSYLESFAYNHSIKMASSGSFAHSNTKPSKFSYWAENIAYVPFNDSASFTAVSMWINSSGHRANMLGGYSFTGIGVYCSSSYCYITQQFGS